MATSSASNRLSDALVAQHYHIHLCATPRSKTFTGVVTLTAQRNGSSGPLTLHARKLEVQAAYAEMGRSRVALDASIDEASEQVSFSPKAGESSLGVGPLTLVIAYKGILADSMHGLYLAKDGPEEALVSQCEASDARAILPCLDEPAFKATYAWTITTEADLDVVTNGVLIKKHRHGKRITHEFRATAKMSTYLLAVTIGRFDSGPKKSVSGIPCRIYAGRNKAKQTTFSMEVTSKVLPWYTTYFGQKYAYHKLDQVAVPGFDAGAMENSGAIFYRQSLLLLDPATTSRQAQKRIAEVIAHEIAHQWFGNLVTMQWWDDLWLNEAFATWIAFKVCNILYPDWQIWLDYLEAKEAALAADALATTHPIWAPVDSPAQATELFDVITYEKGCGVLRMLERFLGDKGFRAGIRRYMKSYRFQNAEGKALWQNLGEATGEDVGAIMRPWVKRPGFPLVSATLVQSAEGAELSLKQTRFVEQVQSQGHISDDSQEEAWPIPMVIAFSDGKKVTTLRHLFTGKSDTIKLPVKGKKKLAWVYANDNASGFYRLRMDDESFDALLSAKDDAFDTSGKMAVLTDQWALMRAGHASIEKALDAFVAFGQDTHPSVFRAIGDRLRSISERLVAEDDADRFRAYVGQFAGAHLSRIGEDPFAKRTTTEAMLYASVLSLMGSIARDKRVLDHVAAWQRQEEADPKSIDANIAGSVVALSAIKQDKAHYAHLLDVYHARKAKGATPELQGRYLGALCMAEQGPCLSLVLDACLDGRIPQEQLRSVIAVLLQRRHSNQATWRWLKEHWSAIAPKVGAMGIARLVEATGALPCSLLDDVQSFFRTHPVAEAARAVKKSAEAMQLWEAIRKRESQTLHAWLQRSHRES